MKSKPSTKAPMPNVSSTKERGYSLVTALFFLAAVTLMAVSASWQGVVQERLAGGQRQSSLALTGADSAARVAERWLYTAYLRSNGEALVGTLDGGNGIRTPLADSTNADAVAYFTGSMWTDALGTPVAEAGLPFEGIDPSAELVSPPVYLIEDLGALRPAGAANWREGGGTANIGYVSGGLQPGANAETRIYRITAKSKSLNDAPVRTVQSVFAGRAKS